jgi:hypothetical protein
MFLVPYKVAPSLIPGAQKGLFLTAPVKRGTLMVAPDDIKRVYTYQEIEQFDRNSIEYQSYIRWFENGYTICPEWTDECYINHSFDPNGLWHLGFVFATRDIPAGAEMTMDYRHLTHEGDDAGFLDSVTGKPIIGMAWKESFRFTTECLARMLA